jgi:hypothetical protein
MKRREHFGSYRSACLWHYNSRPFPPPWMIGERSNASFIVKDATRPQALGVLSVEDEACAGI